MSLLLLLLWVVVVAVDGGAVVVGNRSGDGGVIIVIMITFRKPIINIHVSRATTTWPTTAYPRSSWESASNADVSTSALHA